MKDVHKSFGNKSVLKGMNLTINKGEFISIVGKSGCGKSTLLRLLAGLDKPTLGEVSIGGESVSKGFEDVRIMFQNGRLLPWKTVAQNVALGLQEKAEEKAANALQQVYLLDRKDEWPSVLSGGQQQRVSLARALVHSPSLLLLDEPLGALDALTRLEMQQLIEALWQEKQFTAVLVTHDIEEAIALSDKVILIEEGEMIRSYPIELQRPRKRTDKYFVGILEEILQRVLGYENKELQLQVNESR
nr:ATP-binding cassette domain-containing protein [Halalkalibacterium ligniniphilum]